MYKDSLKNYIDDLAAKKSAPGGGSAAALTASLGAALLSMVANFTLGKEKYKDVEADIKRVLLSSEGLRKKLLDLVDEDVCGYELVCTAYKLSKQTEDEKQKRSQEIQKALKEAMNAPLEVCKCSHQAMKLTPVLADKGNINLVSDVGVAVAFLESAFHSSLLNVEINLKEIKSEECVVEVRHMLMPLEEELVAIKDEVWQMVKVKMASK